MKASECHSVLLRDVLHDQNTSHELHLGSDGGEKSGDTTDVVLEYFTPATRSTTESEIFTSSADNDGFYATQTCRRESVGVGEEDLCFMPSFFQVADGDCSNLANLKRHRAASASPQQRGQQQQSQRQQHCYVASDPAPAALLAKPVARAEYAANRQGPLADDRQRTHGRKYAQDAQGQTQNKREDATLSVRSSLPVHGTSHEASANTLRSWPYPTYAVWSAKAPTANGYIMKASERHDVSQSLTTVQQLHRRTQPLPRRHVPVASPASPAEAVAAASSPAWALTSKYERGVPLRNLPRAAVVTRGEGATLQPASAVAETKKLSKGAKGEVERMRPIRRTTPQRGHGNRDTFLIKPSGLPGAEAIPRRERDARRLPKEIGATEYRTKGGESFFSALPLCAPHSDASDFSGSIHDDRDPRQRTTSSPTYSLQPPTQQQRTSSTGTCSTVSPRSVSGVHPQCGGHSAVAAKHTLINLAASASDVQGRLHPFPAPGAAANSLSPSHCAPTVLCEAAEQTRQCDTSLHSYKTESRPEDKYWEKSLECLRVSTSTLVTTCVAAPAAIVESSKFHQGCTASAEPAKANLWASFFWKSSPHVRLSSSSAGSESCSTQCPSPRGTTAAPHSCAAATPPSKASAPPSSSPLPSAGGGLTGPTATTKGPAFLPWKGRPCLLSVSTDRRQQQHVQQQPFWPLGYYCRASATRQSQRTSAHVQQHQNESAPTEKAQQQPELSIGCSRRIESTRSPLEALSKQAFAGPSWLHMYEATRLEVIGVPRGGGATRLLKSAEILLCKSVTGAPCAAFGARVKEDRNSRQLIFLLPSREVVPVNHLRLLSCISQGSFGTVFRAHWEGKTVAVKQAHGSMTLEAMRSVVREINSFRSLDHPLILKYLGVCLDPNFLGIITEYLPGKSIFEALWESKIILTTAKRLKLCRQLVEAVNYMHTEKRLVHRDLKTSNLILNGDDGLKLCDFGKTRPLAFHGRLRLEDNGGSPRYMAPECFVVGNLIDEKVDVWGLGCCLMEIMGGPIPFENIHSNEGVIQAVTHKQMSPAVPTWFHPSVRTLLQGCFALNPEKRPSAQQILDVLHFLSPEDVDRYGATARRSA